MLDNEGFAFKNKIDLRIGFICSSGLVASVIGSAIINVAMTNETDRCGADCPPIGHRTPKVITVGASTAAFIGERRIAMKD